MKKIPILFFLLIVGCNPVPEEDRFEDLLNRYLQLRYEQFPDWASSINKHDYDHILVIPNNAKLADDLSFCQLYLDSLSSIKADQLSVEMQESLRDHQEQLQAISSQISNKDNFQTNPAFYNIKGPFLYILRSQHAPLENRMRTIQEKMQNVPTYYEVAKANLINPNEDLTIKAIEEHQTTFAFFYETLRDSLRATSLPEKEQKSFIKNLNKTQDAIKDYVAFCTSLKFEFGNLNSSTIPEMEEAVSLTQNR